MHHSPPLYIKKTLIHQWYIKNRKPPLGHHTHRTVAYITQSAPPCSISKIKHTVLNITYSIPHTTHTVPLVVCLTLYSQLPHGRNCTHITLYHILYPTYSTNLTQSTTPIRCSPSLITIFYPLASDYSGPFNPPTQPTLPREQQQVT